MSLPLVCVSARPTPKTVCHYLSASTTYRPRLEAVTLHTTATARAAGAGAHANRSVMGSVGVLVKRFPRATDSLSHADYARRRLSQSLLHSCWARELVR